MDEWIGWSQVDGIEETRGSYRFDAEGDGARVRPGYQDLIAWQRAMVLVREIYRVSKAWPREEQFGLISQIQRAAVAIPSNLAEGHGRSGAREFAHHTLIAYGSLCEVETQLPIAADLGYVDTNAKERLMLLTYDVRRFTLGLLRSLKSRAEAGPHS